MAAALLIARVLLAVVFAVAGLAKLADREGSRRAVVEFGVPPVLAAPLGVILPPVEFAVAVALVPTATAWWSALGALGLLLLFSAGISLSLARGRTPDCHCFGQLHSAPVGWSTLARNVVLATIAGLLVWHGHADVGPSAVSWLGNMTIAQWAGLIGGTVVLGLLAAQGWVLLQLLRQNGRLLLRLEAVEAQLGIVHTGGAAGLPVGALAPRFRLPSLDGDTLTLDALRAPGKPVLLIFANPGCGPCTTLLPDIGRWQREHAGAVTLALVSQGSPEANRAKVAEHGLTHVLLQRDFEVLQAYQVDGTPSAVLVRRDGSIGSPLATGADAIRALVARATRLPVPLPLATNGGSRNGAAPDTPPGPQIGDSAPALALPDLTGQTIELADFRGRPTLVLFWSPRCGFCQRMLPDLKAWEAHSSERAPQLLVVSTGSVDENRAQGLRSPVVLDEGFTVGHAFGADGTPMAVLVDSNGQIASQVVAGAAAILALARGEQARIQPATAIR
jgi:methylamine dehydrogenase accessory protein MauD